MAKQLNNISKYFDINKADIKNNITSNKYIQKNLENKIQNFKGYSVETAQAILNIPGYEVKIRPGEDLVEVPTNYGEKVIAPKRIFDSKRIRYRPVRRRRSRLRGVQKESIQPLHPRHHDAQKGWNDFG